MEFFALALTVIGVAMMLIGIKGPTKVLVQIRSDPASPASKRRPR